MKAQVADYRYRTLCLRIVPVASAAIRIAGYPRDLTMSNSAVYLAGSGYDFTGYSATHTFSPSVVDLEGIAGMAGIDKDKIASGVFDHARWYLFACDWHTPVEDYEPIASGFLGKTTLQDDKYTIEQMCLVDVLNQTVGKTYAAACGKEFGGTEWAGCKKVPVTVTGTLTAVTNQFTVQDSSRTEAADFFGEGKLKFTSGANAGLSAIAIKTHLADGTITVHEPFYYLPEIGDAYELVEGCRKRQADCIAKGNILNFGGDPFIPTTGQYIQRGTK
jgi:uncharacterized phage protein (TIGR02218 family)